MFRAGCWVAFLAGLTAAAQPDTAEACSCAAVQSSAAETLAGSTAVFEGTVTAISTDPETTVSASTVSLPPPPVQVTFEVHRVWKGELRATTIVRTGRNDAACGIRFSLGESYLIYAWTPDGGYLSTGLCSRTRASMFAETDISELGPSRAPASDESSWAGCTAAGRRPVEGMTGGALLLVLLGGLLVRRDGRARRRSQRF